MASWSMQGTIVFPLLLLILVNNSLPSALDGFVCRIFPLHCKSMRIKIVKNWERRDTVTIQTQGTTNVTLFLTAYSENTIIFGLNYYIRDVCKTTLTQFGLSNQYFKLRPLNTTVILSKNKNILFYGNICAFSYSYWSWTWDMWERHIDWIVMKGFNMVYVPIGIEIVLIETFKKVGLPENVSLEFFNGPAFLAWSRMGNMKSYTGPLTFEFIANQKYLQKNITNRLHELGVTVAVPGFSGFVPDALAKIYDLSYFNDVSCWNNFNQTFSCLKQLDPTKPLYKLVGSLYMNFLTNTYGCYDFYAVDMFNENTPKNESVEYLQTCGQNTVSIIKSINPNGKWLLQGWTFGYDLFWSNPNIDAYLSKVHKNDIIVLDMFDEQTRVWNKTNSFFGKPFIWTLINNFGGNTVMNGNIPMILKDIALTFNSSNVVAGFGFMPEGIYENTILLDAIMQYASENLLKIDPMKYLKTWKSEVSTYRYSHYKGNIVQEVVEKLYSSSSNHDGSGQYENNYIIYRRPGINMDYEPNSKLQDNIELLKKYSEIITLRKITEYNTVFLYDLSSILQNSAELVFYNHYKQMEISFLDKDVISFDKHAQVMGRILRILDQTYRLIPSKSLPCYLENVNLFAVLVNDDPEKLISDFKLQLTIWGYNGEILDYAFKMWSHLLKFYYGQRWATYIKHLKYALNKGIPFDVERYTKGVIIVEKNFVNKHHTEICYQWDDNSISIINSLMNEFIDLSCEW